MDGERCPSCGRVWKIVKHKIIIRDKDSLKCDCGHTLISWNGAVMYSSKLIKGPDEDKC